MALASFKLRPFDRHVWIVPRGTVSGVTLRGADADAAFALAEPLFALAGEGVRALSIDLARCVLRATLARHAGKPAAVRVEGEPVRRAMARCAQLIAYLEERARG